MLVVQQNCQKGYENTISALEAALEIGAGLVCLQEPFIGKKTLAYTAFNFYWPRGVRTEARVLTAVRKDILNKIVVENRSDLVDHPYFLAMDIRELGRTTKTPGRRTRLVNAYNNIVGRGHT